MATPEFKDKFIAFVDVLGFKSMIAAAESGSGISLSEIHDLLAELRREKDRSFYQKHGPHICPNSPYKSRDLDFEITQVSDCVIVSAEVSPAGVINLVNHCWAAAIMLLGKGVLVRGFITRGSIFHEGSVFMGSGYQEAFQRESTVGAFKREANELGTPFVELDAGVCEYIRDATDDCVRKMFDRYVKTEGGTTALFPFKMISHSFVIGGFGMPAFDAQREKEYNNNIRKNIEDIKSKLLRYVDEENASAVKKLNHYMSALDEQLAICDDTDRFIDDLSRPAGGSR